MKNLLKKLFIASFDKEVEDPLEDVEAKKIAFEGIFEIIIVSDNHGAKDGLVKVHQHHAGANCFLHCGDSNLEPDDEVMRPFLTIKGNTDYLENYPDDDYLQLPIGERIWMVHGHDHGVRRGIDMLVRFARLAAITQGVRPIHIVVYGHTHKVDVQMQNEVLVINPGSITQPRDGKRCTYARLQITSHAYEIQILDVSDHKVIKEFQFPREYSLYDQDQS